MMRITGIIIIGLCSIVCLISCPLIVLYREELTQWQSSPPSWCWGAVLGVFLLSGIGFLMGLFGK